MADQAIAAEDTHLGNRRRVAPLALYFWTTYQATGSWKPFYASYGKELYVFTHGGVPSYWTNPKGLDTNRDSWKTYLLHCTIGHHGGLVLADADLPLQPAGVVPRGTAEPSGCGA